MLGFLLGDIEGALKLVDESIELASRKPHRATLSWSLQTRAFLTVLSKTNLDVEEQLSSALRTYGNPNQQRRDRLIRLLRGHWSGQANRASLIEEYSQLRHDYQQSWYSVLITLLMTALDGSLSAALASIDRIVGAPVDQTGFQQSFFARQLLASAK